MINSIVKNKYSNTSIRNTEFGETFAIYILFLNFVLHVAYTTFDSVQSFCSLKIQTTYLHNPSFNPIIQLKKLGILEVHLLGINTKVSSESQPGYFVQQHLYCLTFHEEGTLTPQNERIYSFS